MAKKIAKARPARAWVVRNKPAAVDVRADIGQTGGLLLVHNGARYGATGGAQRPQQFADALVGQWSVVHLCSGNESGSQQVRPHLWVRRSRDGKGWLDFSTPRRVFYSSFPDACGHALALEAKGKGWVVHYDCLDLWGGFAVTNNSWRWGEAEREMCQVADVITCSGMALLGHVAGMLGRGVAEARVEVLRNSTKLSAKPDFDAVPDVDCVFVGYMLDDWLDWELLGRLSKQHKLLLIGEPPPVRPLTNRNVEWAGHVQVEDLLPWLQRARVGLIPFRHMPLCWAVDPIKYYDYLWAGLPTVACDIPELDGRAWAVNARDGDEFLRLVDLEVKAALDARPSTLSSTRALMYAEASGHTGAVRARRLDALYREVCVE